MISWRLCFKLENMDALNLTETKKRIAKNACNVYLQQMQGGKLMGCAQPKNIANKMYIYLGVKCDYDDCFVWISNHVSQQKLF